jgi:hypothetical protein
VSEPQDTLEILRRMGELVQALRDIVVGLSERVDDLGERVAALEQAVGVSDTYSRPPYRHVLPGDSGQPA